MEQTYWFDGRLMGADRSTSTGRTGTRCRHAFAFNPFSSDKLRRGRDQSRDYLLGRPYANACAEAASKADAGISTTIAASSTASSGSGKTSLPCRASVRQDDR